MAPERALGFVAAELRRHQVHTAHTSYFGLFNPSPTTMGIAADTMVAGFNPQIAAWSHSPFAAEVERHVVRALAGRFGYDDDSDGVMCNGGGEANHSALIVALVRRFPEVCEQGVRALQGDPVLYLPDHGHDTFRKAARLSGLGTASVRTVACDAAMRLDVGALARSIRADRDSGRMPFLVVGTAGTTAAGSIDPLREIGEVAAGEGLWFHVDAAWGGAAALLPELRGELDGIAGADSITFDAHKWLSVPMCGSVLLTRRRGSLENAFAVATAYMPRDAEGVAVEDPYARSMQWSRRFTGLKLFLSLAVAGWSGYEVAIRRMVALGRELRERLEARGWRLVNDTPLPVVCFVDGRREDGDDGVYVASICQTAVRSGRAWISTIDTGGGKRALRACITNFETRAEHLGELVETLEMARVASSPRAI